jgi:hypothetical protein
MFHYARLMCVLALGAMALSAQVTPANTLQTTAMVGIAESQTARLNLLNPGVQAPAGSVLCTAMVEYLDGGGTVLKTVSVTVAPVKSAGVELHSDVDLSLAIGARREIRATIAIPTVPSPGTAAGAVAATPACKLIPTLEIFDSSSGRTQVVLGHVATVE